MAKRKVGGPGRVSSAQSKATTERSEVVKADGSLMSWMFPGQHGFDNLPIDDIIKKHGFEEYRKVRHDAQVRSALSFKKTLIYARAFDFVPADESAEAEEIVAFLNWNMEKVNVKNLFRQALNALDYGVQFGEKIFMLDEYEGEQAIILKDIKFRYPKNFTVTTDKHGNIIGYTQGTGWGKEIRFTPDEIFHFAHNREFQDHYGYSDLRGIYKNWWAKKFLINFWNVHLERMGSPMMAVKYPSGASDSLKQALKDVLSNLQSKTDLLIPEGVEIELYESMKAGNANFKDALLYHDGEISKGILVPALLGFGDRTGPGPDSLSRLQLRTLFKVTQDIGDQLAFEFMNQIVKPLIDFNYDTDLYPKFQWADYGEFEAMEIADSIRLLHNAGIFDMNQSDVNYARGILGLPLRDEGDEDEVLRPNPAPQGANMPPPPAEQGNEKATTETKGNAE